MSQFVEFLVGAEEPVTLDEAKRNARVDLDITEDDDWFTSVLIPGARQLAETKSGAALKASRWIQRGAEFPKKGQALPLTHGLVTAVESLTYLPSGASSRATLVSDQDYEIIQADREALLAPLGTSSNDGSPGWPTTGKSLRAFEVTYTAGLSRTDLTSRYPSVRQWILLAIAWAYDNRKLFDIAGYAALPDSYAESLLDPITIRTRF